MAGKDLQQPDVVLVELVEAELRETITPTTRVRSAADGDQRLVDPPSGDPAAELAVGCVAESSDSPVVGDSGR